MYAELKQNGSVEIIVINGLVKNTEIYYNRKCQNQITGGIMQIGMDKLRDRVLYCCDCGMSFVFTSGEQAYYQSKQLSVPKRCPECRKKRRESIVPERD